GGVVGNSVGVHQQTVIGDDRDAGSLGLGFYSSQSAGVNGGNDQAVHHLSNHVLNLGDLHLHVILGVLQDDLVAEALQLSLHVGAVIDPALGRLGGHRNTDGLALAGGGVGSGIAFGGGIGSIRGGIGSIRISGVGGIARGAGAGSQGENHGASEENGKDFLHLLILQSFSQFCASDTAPSGWTRVFDYSISITFLYRF